MTDFRVGDHVRHRDARNLLGFTTGVVVPEPNDWPPCNQRVAVLWRDTNGEQYIYPHAMAPYQIVHDPGWVYLDAEDAKALEIAHDFLRRNSRSSGTQQKRIASIIERAQRRSHSQEPGATP